MKSFLTLSFVLMLVGCSLFTQDLKQLSIGPVIGYKAGISAVNTPQGRKNGVAPSKIPDFGVSAYVPLSSTSNLGLDAEIGLSSYAYLMKSAFNDKSYQFNHSYITINPNFYFSGFIIGLSFGIPVSSDYDGKEIKTSQQNILTEIKIGGMIPIFKDETGELNIVIMGGYALSGVFSDFVKYDPVKNELPPTETITKVFNPRIATLGVGFNFLFDL